MDFWIMLGLTIIIIAWLLQLMAVWDKKNEISLWFIFFYCIGVIALIIDGFMTNNVDSAFLNIITLVFSGIVYTVVITNNKQSKTKK